jgi:phage replication initiation protein
MKTTRRSGSLRSQAVNPYAEASACSGQARAVKAQIYGVGKSRGADGERTASAPALPERIAEGVREQGLVPHFAQAAEAFSSPINNMGENLTRRPEPRWASLNSEHLGHVKLVLTDSDEVKTVMVRRPAEKQICIIDWINFTVSEDTWCKTAREGLVTDEQFVTEASRQLEKIFGFGVTAKRDRGMNFYRESWVLGDNMGFVCVGGQRSTMLITVSGHGCLHALPGWERRLHSFLVNSAIRPSISRIDLAHDDFDGAYLSVDWADFQWDSGGFTFAKGGRSPEIQHLGNWKKPSGKGRTLTIGMRSSSKFVRFYEKGRKEGDRESNWCRCEIEFKNTNTIISPDVLLNPSEFFLGAYPCMENFKQFGTVDAATRFEVKQRAAQITMDATEKWILLQAGRHLRVFRELFGDKEALDRLCCPDEDYWPKRLKPLTDSATSGPISIHKQEPVRVPDFLHFISTVPSFGLNGENGFA